MKVVKVVKVVKLIWDVTKGILYYLNNTKRICYGNIKMSFLNKMNAYMQKITEKCLNAYDKNMDPNWINYRDNSDSDSDSCDVTRPPTTKTYFMLLEYNYTSVQLKGFSKYYKLKTSGTKKEMTIKLFAQLYFASFASKIQTLARGYLVRLFNKKLHGPACFKRSICVNDSDFLTMEELRTIPPMQFFSYKDVDGFVYGFDTISLYNLIEKSSPTAVIRNPYNRNEIPPEALKKFKMLIHVGKVLKLGISLELEPIVSSVATSLNFRVLELFQNINALGNYSDAQWFNDLDKPRSLRLIRELFDIWHYRLHISQQTKCAICPPNGAPFQHFSILALREETDITRIKNSILNVLFKMVNTGIDRDNKCLGAYYVLGALTLVNESAALALPWLYQSVSYA